jgi:hypothetical protein
MTRCILCYRCVKVAEQITDGRVHGVINRGDVAEISTYISQAIENDFSGNMIDVCPVGALTDRTFRFAAAYGSPSRWTPTATAAQVQRQTVLWLKGRKCCASPAARTSGARWREFICNTCRFDKRTSRLDGGRPAEDRPAQRDQPGPLRVEATEQESAGQPHAERAGTALANVKKTDDHHVAIFLLVLFVITLTVAAYSTYGERKVAAFLQDRIGPNRAGPFGLLQPLADGAKMFMKEDFVPAGANRKLFFLGPAIAMVTACSPAW